MTGRRRPLGLALALLLTGCGEAPPPPAPDLPARPALPSAHQEVLRREVPGLYGIDTGDLRVTVDLAADGGFTVTSRLRSRDEERTGRGTWQLEGYAIVMTYTHRNGQPLAADDAGAVHRNRYEAGRVMLATGAGRPLALERWNRVRLGG